MKTVILENWQLRIVELEDKELKDLKKQNYFVENEEIVFIDKDYKKIKPYIYYLLNKYKYLWIEKMYKLILMLSLFFIVVFGWLYILLINNISNTYNTINNFINEYIKNEKELKEKIKKEIEEEQKNKAKQIKVDNLLKANNIDKWN